MDLSHLFAGLEWGNPITSGFGAHANPDVPLNFERASSTPTNKPSLTEMWKDELSFTCSTGGGTSAGSEAMFWPQLDEDNKYLQPGAMEAMMKAFQACDHVATNPVKAVQLAEAALEMAPTYCPEAFNVLALCKATSLDEALGFYLKAEEASGQMLTDHEERVKLRTGNMWDDLHLRPLFRAIHGQANTLRKMGRYREALAKYLLLEKYDSNWYTARATYVNYRYHMPAVYLALGNTEAASRYLARWAKQGYSLSSTNLCWHYTRALLDFKKSTRPRTSEVGEYMRYAGDVGEASLIKALQNGPAVLSFLAGHTAMPGGRLPQALMSSLGSLGAAVTYVRAYGDLWRQTPGAIEWAQKNANTFFALLLFREADLDDVLNREARAVVGLKRNVTSLQRLCLENGGIYPNERVNFCGATLLMEALQTPHIPPDRKAPFIRVLLEAGCDPLLCDSEGLTAMHKVCYYESGNTECLELLLKTGVDFCADDTGAPVPSPMLMTLNQGNWRSTERILASLPKGSPYLRQEQLFRWYGELGRSGVYYCLQGGPKCSRCLHDDIPHTRERGSFERAVDVLLRYGLNPTFAVDRELANLPLHRYAKAQAAKHKANNKRAPEAGEKQGTAGAVPNDSDKAKMKMKKACARCSKPASKACGGCRLVWYCSRECQAEHWRQAHKADCSKALLKAPAS